MSHLLLNILTWCYANGFTTGLTIMIHMKQHITIATILIIALLVIIMHTYNHRVLH